MSEDSHRGWPAPQPPVGPRVTPDQFAYIPGQERRFRYHQPNHNPRQPHPAPPSSTGHNAGACGSLPPPPTVLDHPSLSAPPTVDHPSLSTPPTVDHPSLSAPLHRADPPPVFLRPPPAAPSRFSQPPPALPPTPNIPLQAAFHNSPMWHQHNPPPGPQCPQPQGDSGLAPLTPPGRLTMGQEDSRWLEDFEKRVRSCPPPPPPPPPPAESTIKNVKLAEVQQLVVESCGLRERLTGLEEELRRVSSSADQEEWDHLWQQAEVVKVNLNHILEKFQDQTFVEHATTLLRQRRAKRNRVKKRKKQLKLEKVEIKRKREEEETKIDAWRAKLQREEDSKRREEAVKREADSVLSEVRHKQNEGQRMLQLLEALAGLRCTRTVQAAAQGRPRDEEADQRFTATTDMIGKIVKQQLKEYELEEQTLRVMMEESASQRCAVLSAKGDANFARYEDSIRKLLFGPTAAAEAGQDATFPLETLVHRRLEWDQYVVEGDHPLATAVPLSWVLPPAQPDSSWAAFLKR